MTTENGVVIPKEAAKYIEHFRDRMAYMEMRIRWGDGNHFLKQEIEMIKWALPILEAELAWIRDHNIYAVDTRKEESNGLAVESCPACGAQPIRQGRPPQFSRNIGKKLNGKLPEESDPQVEEEA
jgi:hypothetical protein